MISTSAVGRTEKGTGKDQMMNCVCKDAFRAGQGVSYRISILFSGGRTNCRHLSPPEESPHPDGAAYRHNTLYQPNATGTTGIDPTRPPLGGKDDGVPTTVLPTTEQPHARTSRNRAHRKATSPTGDK